MTEGNTPSFSGVSYERTNEMMNTLLEFLRTCWPALLATALAAYLLGSVNCAIIVTRLLDKTDIREHGSGNAGATNVLRSQGKLPALLTTIGDLAKSIISVLLGGFFMKVLSLPSAYSNESFVVFGAYFAGLFCIIGHIYPLYFGFRGGKGVLTTLGMMLILDWKVALICLGIFIVVVALSRMVSLGSCCAVACLPVVTALFHLFVYHSEPLMVVFCTVMALGIAAILIGKHWPNLKRIRSGTESKLSFGSKKGNS